ncbi:hypothetical protein GF377_09415 [candidate division GN15 bacterium]|nr:hypothetical protein [candidate division GN15 bacterium]
MKRSLVLVPMLVLCLALGAGLSLGCGDQDGGEDVKTAGGHPDEMADSTRMDSAVNQTEEMVGDTTDMVEEDGGTGGY